MEASERFGAHRTDALGETSMRYSVDMNHQRKIRMGTSVTVIKTVMATILLAHNLFICASLTGLLESLTDGNEALSTVCAIVVAFTASSHPYYCIHCGLDLRLKCALGVNCFFLLNNLPLLRALARAANLSWPA